MAILSDELRNMLMVIIAYFLLVGFQGHLTTMDDDEFDEDMAKRELSPVRELLNDKTSEIGTRRIEELSSIALAKQSSTLDIGELETHYHNLAKAFDDIIEAIKDSSNAYLFLKAKGLQRVLVSQLGIDHPLLKEKMLILVKNLFEVAPVTTNAVIPKTLLYKVLDTFENDNNLALKAYALDILSNWLPKNPEMQIKVMKLKGLEPFYMQINKLDISVIQTLLDLFNTIIKEHVAARSEDEETKLDYESRILYKRIGLLERMQTSNVCKGLINIFQVLWAHKDDQEMLKTLLELVKNTKPFCGEILKGNSRAVALFENILNFVKEANPDLENDELNLTEVLTVIEDYIAEIKQDRDEF